MEKRMNERVHECLMNLMYLFEALKEPKFVPSKQALDLAAHLTEKTFSK
jgi:hypothetical protein